MLILVILTVFAKKKKKFANIKKYISTAYADMPLSVNLFP